MERMVPVAASERMVHASGGLSAVRGMVYVVLSAALLAGGWGRYGTQVAALMPGSTAQPAEPARVGAMEVAMIPRAGEQQAVAGMGLSAADSAALGLALRRGQLRLARLGMFDATAAAPQAGQAGHRIELVVGGYTTAVMLARQAQAVVVPVGPAATVSVRNVDGADAEVGLLTLSGPMQTQSLEPGQAEQVGVVAE